MGQVGIQLRASGRAAEDTRLRPRRMTCHAASESTLSGRLNAPGMRATSTRGGVTSVLAYPDRRRRQTLGVILSIVLIAAGLVQPATTFAGGPTPSPDATASPTQPPIDHVAFAADDYGELAARLEAAGVEAVTNAVPAAGLRQLFLVDPTASGSS